MAEGAYNAPTFTRMNATATEMPPVRIVNKGRHPLSQYATSHCADRSRFAIAYF